MKKLDVSGLSGLLCPMRTFMVFTIMVFGLLNTIQGQCEMTCPMGSPVPISLSSNCLDTLTYDLLGVVPPPAPCPQGTIQIDIMENGVSIGDTITNDMIGNTYMVVASHESGNSCMTSIIVLDKQAPIVDCPEDVTLACTADLDDYRPLLPEHISDCSPIDSIYIDDILVFSGRCDTSIYTLYERKYIIVDTFLNADTCYQSIALKREDLGAVSFPPNQYIDLTALNCAASQDTAPANTGYPSVNGNEIIDGQFCNLSAIYSDNVAPLCSGGYKVIRTWTVYDWCNSTASRTENQFIEVTDVTPPEVEAPVDFTVSTGSASCSANVIVNGAIITEECSIPTVRMEVEGPFNPINNNGGLIQGLPAGTHRVVFIATNGCGLVGRDTMFVTVKDLTPPMPVCNLHLAIPVNHLGTSVVPAALFDGGSTDNCGDVYFKVKRMTTPQGYSCANPGNPDNHFDDFIQLCCDDIAHNNIRVILRVYDVPPVAGPVDSSYLQGHYNECMVQVQVQDKLPPVIVCPTDLTISCEFPYTPEISMFLEVLPCQKASVILSVLMTLVFQGIPDCTVLAEMDWQQTTVESPLWNLNL